MNCKNKNCKEPYFFLYTKEFLVPQKWRTVGEVRVEGEKLHSFSTVSWRLYNA